MDFQIILNKWNIHASASELLDRWREPHRMYHGLSHLDDLVQQIESREKLCDKDREMLCDKDREMLLITALFHDIIYNPYRNDNEERSAELLLNLADKSNLGDINQIVACILDTKRHIPSSPLSAIFSEMDMNIIKQPFSKLLEWEAGIAYEYSYLPRETYLIRRIIFLQDMVRRYPENAVALSELIEYLRKNK